MAKKKNAPKVVGVRFNEIGKLYHFDAGNVPDVETGDYVIVSTSRGRELGQIGGAKSNGAGTCHAANLAEARTR